MEDGFDDFSMSQLMHIEPEASLTAEGTKRRGKDFNDPVHNEIRLGPASVVCIDSPAFQRLRHLKQLGNTYRVFQGASHNRFEHSIGVAHLATKMLLHLHMTQPGLNISPSDLKVVELAGVCHDLGHGPFSHVFDNLFLKEEGITEWSHEDMSCKLFQMIVEERDLINGGLVTKEEVERVKAIILAGKKEAPPERDGRQFLHEIVANGRNGLDVDKFDYLLRDARMCGVSVGLDVGRIMKFNKVIDNEICYKWSEYQNVKQIYHTRFEMHQRVYSHRKARSIDFMVVDALKAANPVLRITDMIWDPAQFVKLDDTILRQIEHWEPRGEDEADAHHMRAAQAIIRRLHYRDLYKYCGECIIAKENSSSRGTGGWEQPLPEEIVDLLPSGSDVTEEDIIIDILKHNLTAGNSNPLDRVSFFDQYDSTEKRTLKNSDMTALQLQNFEEHKLRVYSRKSDAKSKAAVEEAFRRYVEVHFPERSVMGTPHKQQKCSKANGATLTDAGRKRKLFDMAPNGA